jgi:uncharacterized protein (DUF1499 family)
MTPLATTMVALVVVGLAVRIYMGREAEDRLAQSEAVEIASLRSPLPKASFLACPPGYCVASEAISCPVFDLSWDRLRDYWAEIMGHEKRIMNVIADPENRRFAYIQHSVTFRFPDVVTVEFVQFGANHSGIAIYSRSRYGQFDFGKNRKRVERWLVLLQKVAVPWHRAGA